MSVEVSNADKPPGNGRGFLIECHPGPTGWGAAAGSAERPGVEDACQTDNFVTWDVGVAMEEEICAPKAGRRNMDEEERLAGAFEEQLWRQVETPVVVAQDAVEWPAQAFHSVERLLIAVVAKVPNLVGLPQLTGRRGGESIVRVGDDGDEHESFKFLVLS